MSKVLAIVALLAAAATAAAATAVLDKSAATAANAVAVNTDHQTGLGAWQTNGSTKAQLYVTPEYLFGREVLVSELKSIAYHTKKPGAGETVDWYVIIYTKPYTGGDGTWYGNRLNSEPMYSYNLNAPANQWNQWCTDAGTNQLTFFDQARTHMGFYGGPTLANITAGPINWASYPNSGGSTTIDYSTKPVLYLSLQTGSAWSGGFLGLLDAISITLTDDSSALIDLESLPEVWVDDDFNSSTPGWGVTKFATVQNGVTAVDAGGKVNVAAGTYHEAVTVGKSVALVGDPGDSKPGPGANAPVLDGTGFSGKAAFKLTVGSSGTSISGFVIQNYGPDDDTDADGVVCWSSTPINSVLVADNKFSGLGWNAVLVGNEGQCVHSGWTLARNLADHYWAYGLELTNCTASTIEDNVVTAPADAISGVFMACYDYAGGGNYNVTVGSNTVQRNIVTGASDYGLGIWLYANDFDGGNTVQITGATIANNTVSDCKYGIYIQEKPGASITGVVVNNNAITGNNGRGLTNTSTVAVDARYNWWGDPNGPGSVGPGAGDKVSTNVDYDPWLGKPPQANALYLEPTAASIYIKPTETAIIDLNVANLAQPVTGLQAMLNFSSTYFKAGSGEVAVAPGGGDWDELIFNTWNTGGDLDVAVGVKLTLSGGTSADAKTAIITLTPTGTEGVTRMVFRPDADPDPGLTASTFLSDTSNNPVWPAKINSTNIYIDGTNPTVTSFSADPLCTKTTTTLTFAVSDDNSGVDYVDVYVGTTMVAHAVSSPYVLDMSGYATGCYDVSIKVVDRAGNETDSSPASVCVDKTAPAISNIQAKQGGNDVLCPNSAVQGVVDVYVDVTDDGCADLVVPPTVAVAGISSVNYVGVTGDTYHYQITVLPTTANGSHTITVTAADSLGNSSSDSSQALCVDKNQATGTVSFATLRSGALIDPPSPADYTFTRVVTFVATDSANVVLKTWTPTLSFTNDPGTQTASASYTLTNVPAGMAHLSAKTAWHLRQRVDVALDGSGQVTAAFTLLGGDLNGSNSVNILDYSVLKSKWQSTDPAADINGDGQVQSLDYSLLKANWFQNGGPQ